MSLNGELNRGLEAVVGFWHCVRDDPFVKQVRTIYGANVVRNPRTGIGPGDVVAQSGKRVEIRGALAPILIGEPFELPPIEVNFASSLSGARSTEVNAELGMSLTAAFLAAMGVPVPGADLMLKLWSGASTFNFEVRGVREVSVDVNDLGACLKGRRVDASSPAAAVFFEDPDVRMLLITRTLQAPQFAVTAKRSGNTGVGVSLDAIADLFGEVSAKVEVKSESSNTVSFAGQEAATFAVAAVPCLLRNDGAIALLLQAPTDTQYLDAPDDGVAADGTPLAAASPVPGYEPVIDDDGLLEFEPERDV